MGIYYGELLKSEDGVWRFKRRDFQITYDDQGTLPGKQYRLFPDPYYKDLPRP